MVPIKHVSRPRKVGKHKPKVHHGLSPTRPKVSKGSSKPWASGRPEWMFSQSRLVDQPGTPKRPSGRRGPKDVHQS